MEKFLEELLYLALEELQEELYEKLFEKGKTLLTKVAA